MFKKILVPVDPAHPESMEKSLRLAEKLSSENAEVTVLSVVEDLPQYVAAQIPDELEHNILVRAKTEITEFLCGLNTNAAIVLKHGHASGTIIQMQSDDDYDLIILASHKPYHLDYFLGSTASRVVQKAQCSVMVAR